jgi:DNA polymerase I-like protein with 3'-5' exonuclease and polymerase domains
MKIEQQEPRIMASYSNDETMINGFKSGRDFYATIGTGVYHNSYWDNMERHEDGSPNPEGKTRRKKMKILHLGISYGMGAKSIAASLNIDIKEAQDIVDKFYLGFPKVKKWIEDTMEFAKKNVYVEDFWGRRRRLPDLALPRYEIKSTNESFGSVFNPILGCNGIKKEDPNVKKFEELLSNARGKNQINSIIENAKKCGIQIKDNSGFISQAERQCVNARVQGGAASMSKLAMINVHNSKELKELGFKLLIAVHDRP